MSRRIVEFPSKHGPVLVEVEDGGARGPRPVSRDEVAEKSQESFEAAVSGLRPISESILDQVTDLARTPDEVEVSFGVKISGKLGVILASSEAEAHCQITLLWKRAGGEA